MKGSNVTVSHLWKAHIYVIHMLARPTVYLSPPLSFKRVALFRSGGGRGCLGHGRNLRRLGEDIRFE